MKEKKCKGPLFGLRVLDLTRLYPGPLATMMLGDMGADIIKIEDLSSPDYMRFYPPYIAGQSAGFLAVNRSKRSLALNLKSPDGQDIFWKLVGRADMVIEPFRPGVLEDMGLGYDRACKIKPDIIYVSLTGYGQDGPYARQAGHDINFIGYAGVLSSTALPQTGPVLPGPQLGDVAGGAYMTVIACLAAAWAKKTTGRGQKVDVSMLDGLLPLMTLQMAHVWSTKTSFAPGEAPLSGGLACYGVYRCRDGKYMALGILEEKFWKKFCQMAGRPDWIDQFLLHGDDAKKLRAEIADLFLTKTRAEWTQQAAQLDICLTPVWDPLEVEEDPHIRARGMIIKQDHPACGEVKGIQPPIKFSETPAEPSCPAPVLGQDTFDILSEIGFSADRIKRLENDGIVLTAKTNQDETT